MIGCVPQRAHGDQRTTVVKTVLSTAPWILGVKLRLTNFHGKHLYLLKHITITDRPFKNINSTPAKAMRAKEPSIYLRFPGLCSTTAMELGILKQDALCKGQWEPQNWSILPDFNSSSLQATQCCSALEPGQHLFSRMLWCCFSAPLICWPTWEHMPRLSPNSTMQLLTELSVPRQFPT